MDKEIKIRVQDVNFFYGKHRALKDINLGILSNRITAIIGPSGCGKSTFIRLLNRMNELIPNTTLTGRIYLDEQDIFSSCMDPVELRKRVGMVFQNQTLFQKLFLKM